jgi:transketolase
MTIIAVGPLASTYIDVCRCLSDRTRPNLWALAELPIVEAEIPAELREQIRRNRGLCIAEEHVAHGGAGADFALQMARRGEPVTFHHVHARAHNYGRYGSQRFMREQSGLDPETLLALVTEGR